jgi:hypothetical protein
MTISESLLSDFDIDIANTRRVPRSWRGFMRHERERVPNQPMLPLRP